MPGFGTSISASLRRVSACCLRRWDRKTSTWVHSIWSRPASTKIDSAQRLARAERIAANESPQTKQVRAIFVNRAERHSNHARSFECDHFSALSNGQTDEGGNTRRPRVRDLAAVIFCNVRAPDIRARRIFVECGIAQRMLNRHMAMPQRGGNAAARPAQLTIQPRDATPAHPVRLPEWL